MPEMNGLELLTDIRKKEHLKNTPFVMLTANASADLIHKSIITGVDSYIVKPFQPLALCKKINSMLEAPLDNIA
jgi:two-component system chemotaxis response regulator CheY